QSESRVRGGRLFQHFRDPDAAILLLQFPADVRLGSHHLGRRSGLLGISAASRTAAAGIPPAHRSGRVASTDVDVPTGRIRRQGLIAGKISAVATSGEETRERTVEAVVQSVRIVRVPIPVPAIPIPAVTVPAITVTIMITIPVTAIAIIEP